MRLPIATTVQAAIAALFIVGALNGPARAQSFSAELVIVKPAGGGTGTLHVGGDKVRIETPELPHSFLVVEPAAGFAWLVRPTGHTYVDAKQYSRWSQLLVPIDLANPCVTWQAMAKVAGALAAGGGWRCTQLGEERLDGRATVKYQITSPRGEISTGWIDTKLKFLSRLRDGDGAGMDLAKIEEGPQPDSLFAIPGNFLKLDPQRMLESVKHSDVYVAPQH